MMMYMDDLMYASLRRHVVLPARNAFSGEKTLESKEIMNIGAGAGEFLT